MIPEKVDYIDDEAFLGCTGLRRVILKTPKIRDGGFLPDGIRERVEIVAG